MKDFIKETLVQLHKVTTTDQYGQVSIDKLRPSLFGEKKEEVQKYCKDNKGILNFKTYGSSYGTYTAFTIECADIRKACSASLSTNQNYLRNINRW